MFLSIINDCNDPNAIGRQEIRSMALFGLPVSTIGVGSYADIEASGCLVDILDAGMGNEGVVLVNVAPRHKSGKKWPNGTPFGYFYYKKTLVVATVDGMTLSLVRKLGIAEKINVVQVSDATGILKEKGYISDQKAEYLLSTQFRSYEYSPLLAKALFDGVNFIQEEYTMPEFDSSRQVVWYIDNFGNCKTTALLNELAIENGNIDTKFGKFKLYNRLKDIPDGETGIYQGSSGIEDKRFLELTIQGKSISSELGITIGAEF